MSSAHEHGGPPPGEEPRWLDHPANLKKLTRGFFGFAAIVFLSDVIFFFARKHASFGSEEAPAQGIQKIETWPGFYSVYGLIGIVLLVVLSVGLRKLVMRPEDFYSKDYPESGDDEGGTHHG